MKGELKFEDKCFNEEIRSGKGWRFNKTINFEGQYLNGELNGKVKEYNYNGKLIFEGEYLNGKRGGKGKEYYDNGSLKLIMEVEVKRILSEW